MLQSLLPIKLSEGDPSHQTVEELAEVIAHALNDEDIRNVALTGPFGSGKSSIIQTLMEEHKEFHYLPISLATLQADEEGNEPVVITVEPKGITIQNVGGPDRSIPSADISRGELLISKRYRNRRLGEYLKELELTEGRSTGIPTIQNVLKANGSPRAIVVTDEDRTFFRITIPCHEAAGNIIADIANKANHDPKDDPKELTDRQRVIIEMIIADPFLSAKAISEKISEKTSEKIRVTARTIESDLAQLKRLGVLTREGGRKEGKWVIRIEK